MTMRKGSEGERLLLADFKEAVEKNRRAKQAFCHLSSISGDWASIIRVEVGYDNTEFELYEFARCQLGLSKIDLDRILKEVKKEMAPPKRAKK